MARAATIALAITAGAVSAAVPAAQAAPITHVKAVAPTITTISPTSGPTTGGFRVTVTLDGLSDLSTNNYGTLYLDGQACQYGLFTPNSGYKSFFCTAPAHAAGTVPVTMTFNNLNLSGVTFTYGALPTITSISPTSGPKAGGTLVTVTGTDLQRTDTGWLEGNKCTDLKIISNTQATCVTPASEVLGDVDFRLTNSAESMWMTYTDIKFKYVNEPVKITGFSPKIIAGVNNPVNLTVTGSGLSGRPTISVGGTSCTNVTVISNTSASCTLQPSAAGDFSVTATNEGTTNTAPDKLTVVSGPAQISNIYPRGSAVAGGGLLKIGGQNFTDITTVKVGHNACTNVQVQSSFSLTCTIPAGTAGTASVLVNNGLPNATNGTTTFNYGTVSSATVRSKVEITEATSVAKVTSVLKAALDKYLNKPKVISVALSLHFVASSDAIFKKLTANKTATDNILNAAGAYLIDMGIYYDDGIEVKTVRDNDTAKTKTGFYSIYATYQSVK
jgi:hypothetical protein